MTAARCRVPHVERVSITGLRGCCYLDKTLEGAPTLTEDREAVTLAGWTDRVYRDTPATIQLQVLRPRYLAISTISSNIYTIYTAGRGGWRHHQPHHDARAGGHGGVEPLGREGGADGRPGRGQLAGVGGSYLHYIYT